MRHKNQRREATRVRYQKREHVPFIDLLRNGTEFSKRRGHNPEDLPQYQVRIGTSIRNSFAIPVSEVRTLIEHLCEVEKNTEQKVKELESIEARRAERRDGEGDL